MQRDRVAPRVPAQQVDLAGVGTEQAEQDSDGGRLAGAVRPEEAVHLARTDVEIEPVEGDGVPEVLDQTGDRDRGAHGSIFLRSFTIV